MTQPQEKPDRNTLRAHRQIFWDAWQKAQADLPLNAMEVRIARVIKMHPEHHQFFNDMEGFLDRDFHVDDGMNPYLHLSLHLAIEEQLATKQPIEAARLIEMKVMNKKMDRHEAIHLILEVLAEVVYESQRDGREINPLAYAKKIKLLLDS
ncbi:MAG: DUF1841 family protein [Ghiorsea sp.]